MKACDSSSLNGPDAEVVKFNKHVFASKNTRDASAKNSQDPTKAALDDGGGATYFQLPESAIAATLV